MSTHWAVHINRGSICLVESRPRPQDLLIRSQSFSEKCNSQKVKMVARDGVFWVNDWTPPDRNHTLPVFSSSCFSLTRAISGKCQPKHHKCRKDFSLPLFLFPLQWKKVFFAILLHLQKKIYFFWISLSPFSIVVELSDWLIQGLNWWTTDATQHWNRKTVEREREKMNTGKGGKYAILNHSKGMKKL